MESTADTRHCMACIEQRHKSCSSSSYAAAMLYVETRPTKLVRVSIWPRDSPILHIFAHATYGRDSVIL